MHANHGISTLRVHSYTQQLMWPCHPKRGAHSVVHHAIPFNMLPGLQTALHKLDGMYLREWDDAMTCGKLML